METATETEILQADFPVEEAATGISLLDLAEILDQHKIWVESGGDSGVKADLCGVDLRRADLTGVNLEGAFLHQANLAGADLSMANLRGANLAQADLHDTNLLGTELRGANLMGANLYAAEGVWVGRLGGTNLFDAILPETVAAFDSSKAISDATQVARWFYFLMLAMSAACCALIALTTDAKLAVNAAAIPIPRYGRVLPMAGFYLGAPLVLFAAYLRFHFLLIRLWGSMAALPAIFQDGQTLEKDGPWYLMGLVRRHFRWTRDGRSPFAVLETVVSTALAYWIVPVTLFLFWLRYLAKQDFRGTLLHAALLTLSIAAATCVPTIVGRVLRPGDLWRQKSKNLLRMGLTALRGTLVTGCVLLLLSIGVIRGLPADKDIAPERSLANVQRWAANIFQQVGYRPYADLTEGTLSRPPVHGDWSEEGIASVEGAHLNQTNLRFSRAYRAFLINARLWRANLEGAYLAEADLRGANLREVMMRDAVLDRAQAAHAALVSADGRNANFVGADLRSADLSYGNFENAVLSNAKFGGASMYGVNLRNAQMLRTDLSRTDLRDTKMEQATLSFANLQEADLSSAKLARANLSGARLKGTILLDADLSTADLRGALLTSAIVREANMSGANLSGADFRGALGLTAVQVCSAQWRGVLLDADVAAAVLAQCGGAAVSAKP
ncbi:MAG TPA: pentapeptide repeat-containing protein [Candidatus Acidoferrum sp.]